MTETRDYESKTVDLWASGTEELPFDPTDGWSQVLPMNFVPVGRCGGEVY